jgi:hypothetical protein
MTPPDFEALLRGIGCKRCGNLRGAHAALWTEDSCHFVPDFPTMARVVREAWERDAQRGAAVEEAANFAIFALKCTCDTKIAWWCPRCRLRAALGEQAPLPSPGEPSRGGQGEEAIRARLNDGVIYGCAEYYQQDVRFLLDALAQVRAERDAHEKIAQAKDKTIAVLLSGTVEEELRGRVAALTAERDALVRDAEATSAQRHIDVAQMLALSRHRDRLEEALEFIPETVQIMFIPDDKRRAALAALPWRKGETP